MHRITPVSVELTSSVQASDHLLNLDNDTKDIFKNRLYSSFSQQSKSFELDINRDGAGSCFCLIQDLSSKNDEEFIAVSKEVAELLANSQNHRMIPAGFLVVMECQNEGKPLYVVLKAEPHNALGVQDLSLTSIKDIILSPDQKMYKAAYFELIEDQPRGKDSFKAVLFDSTVAGGSKVANYFYSAFLGLSISNNAKLQTSSFYGEMHDLIDKNENGFTLEDIIGFQDALRSKIFNQETVINPRDIITEILPLEARDSFISKIVDKHPQSFAKDTSLLKAKISNKVVLVSDKVKISAPSQLFASLVDIDSTTDEDVVIIKIKKQ